MRRRSLLRTGAWTTLAGLGGCLESLWTPASPTVRWQTDLPLSWGPADDVVQDHGVLYVETDDDVVALDPVDGERTWTFEQRDLGGHHDGMVFAEGRNPHGEDGRTVAAVEAPGTVAWTVDGRYLHAAGPSVYLLDDHSSEDQTEEFPELSALDPSDGGEQWTYRFDYPVSPFVQLLAPDAVYVVDSEPGDPSAVRVSCLDPPTATARWHRRLPPGYFPTAVLGHDRLFVGTERPDDDVVATVTALNTDGTERWQHGWDRPFAFPRWVRGPNVVVELARNLHTGEEWTTVLFSEVHEEERWRARGRFVDVREDEGQVVLFTGDALVAVDRTDGEQRHCVDVSDHWAASDADHEERAKRWPGATSVGETVYVTPGETLLAVGVEDGVRWTFEADRPLGVLGVVDGVVYAGTAETVYALAPP